MDQNNFLVIPPGEHVLDEPLTVPSNSIVQGSGAASVLSFPGIDDGPCVVNKNNRDVDPGDENITLRDFAVKGGGNGRPTGPVTTFTQGIRLQKVKNFDINGVKVTHTGFGMFLVGIEQGIVNSCYVSQTGRDGIHLVSYMVELVKKFDRRPTKDVIVTGCRVYDVGDDCIAVHCGAESHRNKNTLEAPTGIIVSNNSVGRHPEHMQAQGRGVIFTGVQGGQITSNNISDTVSCGIWLQEDHHSGVPVDQKFKCKGVICSNNIMRNVGQVRGAPNKPQHAMRFIGIEDCRINGNISFNHKDRFIRANRMVNTNWDGNMPFVGTNRIEILDK